MVTLVKASALGLLAGSVGVERAAPDGPPTAFRIWRAGANVTDKGTHVFSEQSAEALMSDQRARANLYSIDVDHLSLNDQAPPDSHIAVGWHTLDVRPSPTGPELWAVNVEWSPSVAAGLTETPPKWRYFSPAYGVSKSGEIVSYVNTAITNQPATHEVTALATVTKGQPTMDVQSIVAALFGDDDDKKKEAKAALAKMSEEERTAFNKECKAAFGDDDESKPEKKPEEEEKPKDDEAEKAAVKATIDLAAQNLELANRLKALEDDKLTQERETILAGRKDLPAKLVKTLREMPLTLMKATIASIDPVKVDPTAAQKVQPTLGNTQTGDGVTQVRASRLPPTEAAELRQRFGQEPEPRAPFWSRSDKVYPVIKPEFARRILTARKIPLPPVAGRPSPDLINAVRESALRASNGGSQ